MDCEFKIDCCPAAQRPDALRALHAGLTADQQMALVHALQAVGHQDESEFDGLFIAVQSEEIIGATWAQLTAGHTAVAWLPEAQSPAAPDLMHKLSDFFDSRVVALAQFLVGDESTVDHQLLEIADFKKLAKLAYLAAEKSLFQSSQPDSPLLFKPNADRDPARLGKLLLDTYQGSLDCPQLDGVRSSEDVLAGYRQQGTFSSDRWFFVEHQGQDIGVLILTSHPDSGNWELVYMGIVQAARGVGFGKQILDFAMWQAAQSGAERLVLAVDQANPYALEVYQRAGFVAWDYRTVFARLRPQSHK